MHFPVQNQTFKRLNLSAKRRLRGFFFIILTNSEEYFNKFQMRGLFGFSISALFLMTFFCATISSEDPPREKRQVGTTLRKRANNIVYYYWIGDFRKYKYSWLDIFYDIEWSSSVQCRFDRHITSGNS